MKKLFDWFAAKNQPEQPKPEQPKVIGVSEAEWHEIIGQISKEYKEAKSRQKDPNAAPSQYMKGLVKAISIMNKVAPHNLMEV